MTSTTVVDVERLSTSASSLSIHGDVTAASEGPLMDAYTRATADGARAIVLDFSGLDYMNSGGIGLLVTLLVRVQRQSQKLLAVGLSAHYREIFSLTRLDEAIELYDDNSAAMAALGA